MQVHEIVADPVRSAVRMVQACQGRIVERCSDLRRRGVKLADLVRLRLIGRPAKAYKIAEIGGIQGR